MTTPEDTWHLGIGDPTPIGWITVLAYAAAAFACWRVLAASGAPRGSAARFWLILVLALGALGINKQLDLQTALTELGRSLALAQGWYEQRRAVQFDFIVAIAVLGALAMGVMIWLSLPLSGGRLLAMGGVVFLVSFVLIRAASFHHVDVFLNRTVLGMKWNWVIELTGIGLAGAGALAELWSIQARDSG